jgi:ABC-type branched-subunit amino acid transport system substrate-binding protein
LCSNEIKIGNITCATGWAKEYGAVARAEAAYFAMVNDRGGINGTKIKFISLDDGCDSQNLQNNWWSGRACCYCSAFLVTSRTSLFALT